jgi:hypothetical protein
MSIEPNLARLSESGPRSSAEFGGVGDQFRDPVSSASRQIIEQRSLAIRCLSETFLRSLPCAGNGIEHRDDLRDPVPEVATGLFSLLLRGSRLREHYAAIGWPPESRASI